ncbi:hypothetical protein BDZ91DRAFT_766886 [Kalaharituber pfeilii]|nr:hypothetical protein BDZ91DRAFT_766886 [Kalaharituber pfeilii]
MYAVPSRPNPQLWISKTPISITSYIKYSTASIGKIKYLFMRILDRDGKRWYSCGTSVTFHRGCKNMISCAPSRKTVKITQRTIPAAMGQKQASESPLYARFYFFFPLHSDCEETAYLVEEFYVSARANCKPDYEHIILVAGSTLVPALTKTPRAKIPNHRIHVVLSSRVPTNKA